MPKSLNPGHSLRPADLARRHGISTQAVRNYEQDGFLPPADRTPSGYRIYTELHAAALRAFVELAAAHGHAIAGPLMQALTARRLDLALGLLDDSHALLARDRQTLAAVRAAVGELAETGDDPNREPIGELGIGALAYRLGVTPATIRTWERSGILRPERDPATGYRSFRADDVRDAELTHLLRRGGTPLGRIATVVDQVRRAGGSTALAASLDEWGQRLIRRGVAMITADRALADYLDRWTASFETDIQTRH
ncbi:TioE family transcriptional regulator [Microlunatus speluncae]|uniref:TioE family transcriptional regulator n=1 Tax=Microlunatus speluncae TaxID=2594267 RepID=UPI001266840E|nr:TioE family transcriptional regulator [Microlunatus speluncae]